MPRDVHVTQNGLVSSHFFFRTLQVWQPLLLREVDILNYLMLHLRRMRVFTYLQYVRTSPHLTFLADMLGAKDSDDDGCDKPLTSDLPARLGKKIELKYRSQ